MAAPDPGLSVHGFSSFFGFTLGVRGRPSCLLVSRPLPPAAARRHPHTPPARPPARPSAPGRAPPAPPFYFIGQTRNVQKLLRRRRVIDARELRELRARHTTHHGDWTTTPLSPPLRDVPSFPAVKSRHVYFPGSLHFLGMSYDSKNTV